ncbi:hypothetical protein NKH18_20765 [Streptomyces sp. M10(2022)]
MSNDITGPAFMLRVAGLPFECVQELRCPRSRRWADEVLDATERLSHSAQRAADQLHDLIGGSDDEPLRRTLLGLRRDVFNNRLPGPTPPAGAWPWSPGSTRRPARRSPAG